VERWFQNTRGLVIVILAVATCALLLAIEPGDGFPSGAGVSSGGDGSASVTTATTAPPAATSTTVAAKPTLQEGSTDTANVTALQQQLNAHGYDVGTPDGNFGPGTKAQVVKFQQDKNLTPADGVVNQATWDALLKPQ
jgi:peptidoglycan hydrolase-like protein with peptidoglycan-binding domain